MNIDIGINETDRKEIMQGLSRVLADTQVLYGKTLNFHWNVMGPNFAELHELFEKQYLDLFSAIDETAERIRALGFLAPGNHSTYQKLATIKESPENLKSDEMVKQLVSDHETIVKTLREVYVIADKAHDAPSVDLLTRRLHNHEKTAWMLRSLLAPK